MNRLVIIGNGFDLAHNLNTRYKDFIFWYLEKCMQFIYKLDEYEYRDILISIKTTPRRDAFDNIVGKVGNDEFNDYFNKPETERKPWGFLRYLKSVYDYSLQIEFSPFLDKMLLNIETKGWTDIESDYYELLKDNSYNTNACKSLNEQMDLLRTKLKEYLLSLPEASPISQLQEEFVRKVKKEEIAYSSRHLMRGIFEATFIYLPIRIKYPTEFLSIKNVMLLNFNYTNTIVLYDKGDYEINYIHGSLCNPEEMIFGYGDEMDKDFKMLVDLNNNELLKNSKSVKYLETGKYKDLLRFINGGLFQVYVMGHSCGNSDRTLLNTIFEHKNCISIKPYCFQYKNANGAIRDNYSELTQNIYRNFKDKTLFRDRVVNKEQCTTFEGKRLK